MPATDLTIPTVLVAPLSFRLTKWLQRYKVKGSHQLGKFLQDKGFWDVLVRHSLGNDVNLDVPIKVRPFDRDFIMNYEHLSIEHLAPLLGKYSYSLVDCGADIGLVSARLISAYSGTVARVVAFEPNSASHAYLANNATHFGIPVDAKNMAVSNFHGRASLKLPDFDHDDHAAYIVQDDNGPIEVTTIDQLHLPTEDAVLIKIDVEGEELSVVQGAAETIANATRVIVLFEAHHRQVKRTGIDPTEILTFLMGIRPFKAEVVEAPGKPISTAIPFYKQFPERIYNICAVTE